MYKLNSYEENKNTYFCKIFQARSKSISFESDPFRALNIRLASKLLRFFQKGYRRFSKSSPNSMKFGLVIGIIEIHE